MRGVVSPAIQFRGLLNWLNAQQCVIDPKLTIRIRGDSWSLEAREPRLEGSSLVELQPHCTMGIANVRNIQPVPVQMQPLFEQLDPSFKQMFLGLRLLSERCRSDSQPSFWHPYISVLPSKISSPIFFDQAAINDLQFPWIQQQIKMRAIKLHKTARLVQQGFQPYFFSDSGSNVDVNQLGWATACASSRAFSLSPALVSCYAPFDSLDLIHTTTHQRHRTVSCH